MIKSLRTAGIAAVLVAAAIVAHAQDKGEAQKNAPLKVQVVIARYDGDKKISNMPYLLSVSGGHKATLRMGTAMPIATTTFTPAGAPNTNPLTSYNYRDVGTNIDCTTTPLDEGRFLVELNIEDSSVEDRPPSSSAVLGPSFRSFRANNSFVLKDGQTAQFTTAVDKITGVVTKVDVTLTVVK